MEESEKISIALKCVNKNWDFDDLKYCDDIGKIAFIQKHNLK